ncbi:MAG TPA: substrate-binding domain-containing protein [Anaerolineae bacterium]|nr:substrate-binding domain-containing protein [Anaerolineae bacterium]HQK13022.1 substrate-binding domain-containing protein [Anaerolineae bacterium]
MDGDERARGLRRKPRPALGLVTHQVGGATAWWLGAAEVARRAEVDLFIFNAGNVGAEGGAVEDLPSSVHHLVSAERLDALVLVQWWPTRQIFDRFYRRYYSPLPAVNLHRHYEGFPGISIDNRGGMEAALRHLIEAHGYRRLVFIGGLPDNPSAQARYEAYLEVLNAYDIPFDEKLVLPGDFSPRAGTQAIHVLLDERGLHPGRDFDAIVASNDYMALAALEELQRRGFDIPLDVAVVGFDDVLESAVSMPPLTTVRMPNDAMGRLAAEKALALLRGEAVADAMLPGELVVRQSCGCFVSPLAEIGETAALPPVVSEVPHENRRTLTLTALQRGVGPAAQCLRPAWAEELLDAFAADIAGPPASHRFIEVLYAVLQRWYRHGYDVMNLGRTLLFTIRHFMSSDVVGDLPRRRAEGVWQQAMAFMTEVVHQMRLLHPEQAGYSDQLRMLGEQLIATFDMERLLDLIMRELPRLHIPACYIALYEDGALTREQARLVFACNAQGRNPLGVEGQRFEARRLLPDELMVSEHPTTMVVTPLYFQEIPLGFALFEVGPEQGEVYETLSRQISSTLMGALLTQRQIQAQHEAEAARQQAQATLNDLLTTRAITDRVRQAPNTEAILRVTLESLGKALGATMAVARLGTREQLLETGTSTKLD